MLPEKPRLGAGGVTRTTTLSARARVDKLTAALGDVVKPLVSEP